MSLIHVHSCNGLQPASQLNAAACRAFKDPSITRTLALRWEGIEYAVTRTSLHVMYVACRQISLEQPMLSKSWHCDRMPQSQSQGGFYIQAQAALAIPLRRAVLPHGGAKLLGLCRASTEARRREHVRGCQIARLWRSGSCHLEVPAMLHFMWYR